MKIREKNKMKFRLTTTGSFYEKREAEELQKLGFKFKSRDKTQFFNTIRESFFLDSDHEVYVEIKDLNDLLKLQDKYGDIIITKIYGTDKYQLEIYNDYRE